MIEIKNLTRKYGERLAVDQLSLHVSAGEVLAFLGPNGAGKTTTIKTLVGLLLPSSGEVKICGHNVVLHPQAASRCIGYVPDQPFLYEKLTGREFLQFTAEMYGMPADEAAASIDRQIQAFQLQEFVDRLGESYSHGMKQRVVFAAAMVHAPPVLVVDEPMVGLDPRSMRIVKTLLRRRAAEGTSVFLSTHTLSVAEEIADRIGIIYHGRLQFLGNLQQLREEVQQSDSNLEELFLTLTDSSNDLPTSSTTTRDGLVVPLPECDEMLADTSDTPSRP